MWKKKEEIMAWRTGNSVVAGIGSHLEIPWLELFWQKDVKVNMVEIMVWITWNAEQRSAIDEYPKMAQV